MKTIISAIISCFLAVSATAELRTYLGVETVKSSKEIQSQLSLDNGTGHTVTKVHPESPADKCGLKVDDIIYKIDSKKVKNLISIKELIWATHSKGDEISITFYRQGKEQSTKALLDSKEFSENTTESAATDQSSQAANQQKAIQDVMKQLQKGGLQNLLKNGGAGISTMMVDGEHRIAVSGKGKDKHVKVINSNSNEVEFEGDIIDNDFSDVPSDLRPKVEKAITMLSGLNIGGMGGKGTPKAKDDSAEKVDDFIKEIEKKKSSKEDKEEKQ